MPIFGNNGARLGSLQLTDTDLFGHFDPAFIAGQGNPVPGGIMRMSWASMAGAPFGQPNAVVQLGVYDATPPVVPANWPLVAVSAPFNIVSGSPPTWYSTPIAGVLVPGNSYATAILSTNGGAFSGAVDRTTPAAGGGIRAFIGPGVFPNPLGVVVVSQQWCIYTYYTLPDGNINVPVLACCSEDD